MTKLLASAVLSAVVSLTPVSVFAQDLLKPEQASEAKGFKTSDSRKGKFTAARDISGIACVPTKSSAERPCLVINDQDDFAQLATLEDGKLKAGELVNLLDEEHEDSILGREPKRLKCSGGKADFKDLDGEGVAYRTPYFYVVGSHGCSRKDRLAVPSAFILARVRVDTNGALADDGSIDRTFRLNDALRRAEVVRDYFGRDLNEADGLNIEGIAVVGEKIYVGLRAPSVGGKAFLVAVETQALFAPGDAPLQGAVDVVPLELGENVGIRDLAVLVNGSLLVLAGPTREQANVPFRLYAAEPRVGGSLRLVATLEDVEDDDGNRAKAEALLPLDDLGQRVMVLFDGLKNGGPRTYKLP